jgi:hypothetical protein
MMRLIFLAILLFCATASSTAFANYPTCTSSSSAGYCMSPGGKLYSCGDGNFVTGACTNSMTCSDVCAQCQGGAGGCMNASGTPVHKKADQVKTRTEVQ